MSPTCPLSNIIANPHWYQPSLDWLHVTLGKILMLQKHDTNMYITIPFETRILNFMFRFANGHGMQMIVDVYGLGLSVMCEGFHHCCESLVS